MIVLCVLIDHCYRVSFNECRSPRKPEAWAFCGRCGRQFTKDEFYIVAWNAWRRLWFHLGGYSDKKKIR